MDYFVLKQYESSNALLSLKTSKVMRSCFFFFFLVHAAPTVYTDHFHSQTHFKGGVIAACFAYHIFTCHMLIPNSYL